MRFEHDGIAMWFGTADAPAVSGNLPFDNPVSITIGVFPADASNSVEIVYRVNRGKVARLQARHLNNRQGHSTQYFKAVLPTFELGDTVDYAVICRCAGRQVPPASTTETFAASICIVEAGSTPVVSSNTVATSVARTLDPYTEEIPQPSDRETSAPPNKTGTKAESLPSNTPEATVLRLLSTGRQVQLLQRRLVKQGFSIDEGETRKGYFGLSTRKAVEQFQHQQSLPVTGNADSGTLAALKKLFRAKAGFNNQRLAGCLRKQNLRKLGLSAREFSKLDADLNRECCGRMVSTLKRHLIELFEQPSAAMVSAIGRLQFDLEDIDRQSMSDLVFERVVPALMRDKTLERELLEIAEKGLAPETETVADVLGLNRDVRDSDELSELVNRSRNVLLGDIFNLDDAAIASLGNIDISDRSDALYRLERNDKLTEQQRDDMLLAADLTRLTDDNIVAIRALRERGLRHSRELIAYTKADWLQFIRDYDIEPPQDESAESYATLLDAGVETAFPTAFALTRYASPLASDKLERFTVLERFRDRDEPLFGERGLADGIDLSPLSEDDAAEVKSELGQLAEIANRYESLGVKAILNDRNLPVAEKQELVQRRLTALQQVQTTHPGLDLELANFTPLDSPLLKAFRVNFESIEAEDRPYVRKALMSLQRTRSLCSCFEQSDRLMAVGLDSAVKVAALDDTDELIDLTGLNRTAAANIRQKALATRSHLTHFLQALENTTDHTAFLPATLKESGTGGPDPLVNVLKDLPGYSELFGSQNYCKCKHCQSIFGPAAYFVDLMRFIDKKISKPNFTNKNLDDHPLYLKRRRNDLWQLSLTCENTNTLVLYLQIVNEVLENYLELVAPVPIDVFAYLANEARSSFQQPFNLPHAEVLLYLQHLGVKLGDISALFATNRQPKTHAILGISPQELAAITTSDTSAVRRRFGVPDNADLGKYNTAVLTQKIGVDRDMLDRMLSVNYVRSGVEISTSLISVTDDLIGFEEHLRIELTSDTKADGDIKHFLDRLHRFARLQRALGWTPEEIQLALESFNSPLESGSKVLLDVTRLDNLAELKRLVDGLDLSVSEALGLCGRIPTKATSPDSDPLWIQLFGSRKTLTIRHPELGNTDPEDPQISSDFGVLQGALRLSEPDMLSLVRRKVPPQMLSSGILVSVHIHELYLSARLARAFKLSQQELIGLERVIPNLATPKKPFETVNKALSPKKGLGFGDARTRLIALIEAMETVKRFDDLSVRLGDLLALIEREALANSDRDLARETLLQVHAELQTEESLWITPTQLSSIEGISPEAARAIIDGLVMRDAPWLIRIDESTERYSIAEAVPARPDNSALIQALSVPGAPLEKLDVDDHSVDFLTKALGELLYQRHPGHAVSQAISRALDISGDIVEALAPLMGHLRSLSESNLGVATWLQDEKELLPDSLIAWVIELIQLKRLLVDVLDSQRESIGFIINNQLLFGLSPGGSWGWATLENLAYFTNTNGISDKQVLALQNALTAWEMNAFSSDAVSSLAQYFNIKVNQVETLLKELPDDNNPFDMLRRLEEAIRLTRRTGLDPASLKTLTSTTFESLSSARDLLLGAMQTKYPTESAWGSVIEPFLEKVEGIKRDALVDRILSRPELKFENARDIYHFFLLDPEMDGCFRTSRVKNAISSCQLYMQRCLMGLEQLIDPDTEEVFRVKVRGASKTQEEWKWRKNYRIWEANRKVFLYPENYLLPDLRDDRSHVFKAAERDLLQGDLSEETVEQAFNRYISEFAQVGNFEIVNIYFEESKKTYLMFARTRQEPFRYFSRRFKGNSFREPWQPIDLDIGARSISAVKRQEKLYLFWTNIELGSDAERVKQSQDSQPQPVESEEDNSKEFLPITFSYSIRDEAGNWSSPKDILYYNLFLSQGSVEKHRLLPISDRIYAEYPHPTKGSGGVGNFVRLIHPVGVVPKLTSIDIENPSDGVSLGFRQYRGFLRESDGITIQRNGTRTLASGKIVSYDKWTVFKTPGLYLGNNNLWYIQSKNSRTTADVEYIINGNFTKNPPSEAVTGKSGIILSFSGVDTSRIFLSTIQRKTQEALLNIEDSQYMLKRTGKKGLATKLEIGNSFEGVENYIKSLAEARWKLIRLTTEIPTKLSVALLSEGITSVLSPSRQYEADPRALERGISFEWLGQIKYPDEDLINSDEERAIYQFSGPHGNYLWEVFFHLPFLIAYQLNSMGQFENADRWYRYIFDPTASSDDLEDKWRFILFRTLKQPKLRELLTQQDAIDVYKQDPFNPFAIARLRNSAFQKTIVMNYIDNLIDWADELFRRDTRESLNEALLLYIMVADLLGKRPIETGQCQVTESMTYSDIVLRNKGCDFLIELESLLAFSNSIHIFLPIESTVLDIGLDSRNLSGPNLSLFNSIPADIKLASTFEPNANFESYSAIKATREIAVTTADTLDPLDIPSATNIAYEPIIPDPTPPNPDFEVDDFKIDPDEDIDPDGPLLDSRILGFCVPPNDILLGYWDRVDDRLYKLRHCMNIEGVERQLPLWQPPIDPLLLVRAKAAGLDLDAVLAIINEQPPQHRFEVLLDRARRFTATAQQLGNQLLSALEKKDESELTLLRSVHEDAILNLVRNQKVEAIDEARENHKHLCCVEQTIQTRVDYFTNLLESKKHVTTEAGLGELAINEAEKIALEQMQNAKDRQDAAGEAESKAQRYREIGPQWSAGTAVSVGQDMGNPIARTTADSSAFWGSVNIEARFQRRAFRHRDAATEHSTIASMTSTRASYERRQEEWEFNKSLAEKEMRALVPQKEAANIRISIAEKDLETHDAQIKNSREIYDFAKKRFTSLGLYTYLSTSLSRLYREAYDMAFKMAQTAERAYRFETGEDSFFLKQDNWSTSRAGLLAGDRLLLQLQAMEAAFVERDRRRQEITLPCSLSQIDPNALHRFRQTGRTEIVLPEWWFDLHRPGQYRRMLQAVRLTIPCIVGPYSTVAAKLTLLDSAIRQSPSLEDNSIVGIQVGRNTSISTSSANSDPGVFELRFDAPKHPPFKGAGAISTWVLELPRKNRVFDYSSISDVILEVSYTAEDDGRLRQDVEGQDDTPGSLDLHFVTGLHRIISLKHEFPSEFHRLTRVSQDSGGLSDITLKRSEHFPYWLSQRAIQINEIDISFEPLPDRSLSPEDISEVSITLNGDAASEWRFDQELGNMLTTSYVANFELNKDPVTIALVTTFPEGLNFKDILIRLHYSAT